MLSIQSIMLVALGFLTAALLALTFAPAFWSRAVRLTTQRIKERDPSPKPRFAPTKIAYAPNSFSDRDFLPEDGPFTLDRVFHELRSEFEDIAAIVQSCVSASSFQR